MAAEGGPLWVDGEIVLRLEDAEPIRVARPYALIGRAENADLRIIDARASARHLYLHLDRRGVFAVDLATRTGTRFGGEAGPTSWVDRGQSFEVAGHRVELVSARVEGREVPSPKAAARRPETLTDTAGDDLPRLALYPLPSAPGPWTLSSELVFLGRSTACGVPVHGSAAARVHAVIVRTTMLPYIVNLIGAGLWVDGRPVRTAAMLVPEAVLTVGASRFAVQLDAAPERPRERDDDGLDLDGSPLSSSPGSPAAARFLARVEGDVAPDPWPTELVLPEGAPPPPPELFQGDSQAAVLAWMMGVVQATQTEMMRRQHDFQMELIRALRGLHEDNQAVLEQHEARVEAIHRELASLRDDIRQRFGGAAPAARLPVRPKGPPIQIPQADATPSDPATATAWLLDRVNHLDEANRATWRDLLGRLGGGKG